MSIRTALLAAALAATLALPAAADTAPKSMTVAFDRAQLETEAGAEAVYSRVRIAARRVCRADAWPARIKDVAEARACMRDTIARTVDTIDHERVAAAFERDFGDRLG